MSYDKEEHFAGGVDQMGEYNEFVVGGEGEPYTPPVQNISGGYWGGDDDEERKMGGSCCDGGNEMYDENRSAVGGYYGGYDGGVSGGMVAGCAVAFVIVVVVLMLFNRMKKSPKRKPMRKVASRMRKVRLDNRPPIRHIDVFDNVLVSPNYFDFDQHGMKYINWGGK